MCLFNNKEIETSLTLNYTPKYNILGYLKREWERKWDY